MQKIEETETKTTGSWTNAREWNTAIARSILAEVARQKLSISQFAKDNDLSAPRIYYWKKKLDSKKSAPKETVFIPARIVAAEESSTKELDDDHSRLELISPSKWTIRCFGSIDTQKLQLAIQAIGDHQ